MTIEGNSGASWNKPVVTVFCLQEASRVLYSNACWPIVTDGVTMLLDVFLDILLRSAPQPLENIDPSRDLENGRKASDQTLSPYTKRFGMIALVLAVACMARDSVAQTAKESIDVPPHSRLLLRAVGSGDQVYGCLNGRWALIAPDAELLNQGGSVIGRHFAGPTWQLNDGSWVKGRAVAKQIAPNANAVPWLLLESVDGNGRLETVRFIQRTGTRGGNAPVDSCSQNAMRRVPYTATYSFYEAGQ
jgi:hypothetical protein